MDAIPLKYRPGSLLTIKFSESHTVTFISEKVLTQCFTRNQVLVVRPQTIPLGLSPPLSLDSWYILKAYDPRYDIYRECRESRPDGVLVQTNHPWSLEAELKAVAFRHSVGLQIWEYYPLLDYFEFKLSLLKSNKSRPGLVFARAQPQSRVR
jgi:hypothetical protein